MLASMSDASADSCSTITVSGPSGGHLVLSPSKVKATVGDCIAFKNATSGAISLSSNSSPSYSASVPKGATTSSGTAFHPKNSGTDTITATGTTLLILKDTGTATIDVSAAPKPTPTATKSPGHGKQGGGKSGKGGKGGKSPTVAPHPHHKHHGSGQGRSGKHGSGNPKPHATGINLPPLPPLPTTGASAIAPPKGTNPLVAPHPTQTAAVTTTDSSTPVAAVISGPIEPIDSDRRGLPVAVGLVVVIGLATGWGRVLLAQPAANGSARKPAVDGRRRATHRL
jgi:hypothetical protein